MTQIGGWSEVELVLRPSGEQRVVLGTWRAMNGQAAHSIGRAKRPTDEMMRSEGCCYAPMCGDVLLGVEREWSVEVRAQWE